VHVFAYGSLIWNPGFPFEEAMPALARGWQRKWCVRSTVHRGTPETPGFVLGLVPGGACVGLAYRVAEEADAAVTEYLQRREMAEAGYRPAVIEVEVPGGMRPALCYVAETCCDASPSEIVAAARRASGKSGPNADYLVEAVRATGRLILPAGWPGACPGLPSGIAEELALTAG